MPSNQKRLTLQQKQKICEESLKSGFDRKMSWKTMASPSKLSVSDFAKALNIVRSFVQSNGADRNSYFVLHQLENQCIKKRFIEANKQAKMTEFFSV